MTPPKAVLFFALLLTCSFVSGVRIYGTVFDEDLQAARSAIQINTTPEQQIISANGTYEFTVPAGTYRLAAVGDNASAEKTITIQNEGEFRIDLILLPGVPPEDSVLSELLDVPEVSEPKAETPQQTFALDAAIAITIGVFLIAALIFAFRDKLPFIPKSRTPTKHTPDLPAAVQNTTNPSNNSARILTADQNKVLQTLSSFNNRASQKDLRKALNHWSEAKVSMELTELEDIGAIQKIKKGRGNVIRKA